MKPADLSVGMSAEPGPGQARALSSGLARSLTPTDTHPSIIELSIDEELAGRKNARGIHARPRELSELLGPIRRTALAQTSSR